MHMNNHHQLKYDVHKVLNHNNIFQKQKQLHQALLFHLYFEQFEAIKKLFNEHIHFMFIIELKVFISKIYSLNKYLTKINFSRKS
jgi:hypothetical protein